MADIDFETGIGQWPTEPITDLPLDVLRVGDELLVQTADMTSANISMRLHIAQALEEDAAVLATVFGSRKRYYGDPGFRDYGTVWEQEIEVERPMGKIRPVLHTLYKVNGSEPKDRLVSGDSLILSHSSGWMMSAGIVGMSLLRPVHIDSLLDRQH